MTVNEAMAVIERNVPRVVRGTREEVYNAHQYDKALQVIGEAIKPWHIDMDTIMNGRIPDTVYIQMYGDDYASPALYNWVDKKFMRFYFNDLEGESWYPLETYGKTWRMWTASPTDEQMGDEWDA